MNADWETVRLGDFCQKIGSGSTPKGGSEVYLEKGEVSLIRSQNIYNDGFNPNGIVYLTTEAADKLKNVGVEKNDILLNITGDSVARVCLVDAQYLPARVNQHVLIIRPNPTNFDARFLRYYLVTPKIQNTLLGIAAVGATRNALTKGMIESLEVPKPNLSVQKSIADKLESLDNKITLNRQINQTLEAMAQALFKSWFVDFEPVKAKMAALSTGGNDDDANLAAMSAISGKSAQALLAMQTNQPEQYQQLYATAKLFPSEMVESELGEIPKGWEVKSLDDEFDVTMGQSPPGESYNELGEGVPFFQGRTDFGFRYPTNRVYTTQPSRMAKSGDTLLSVRAPVGDINKASHNCCLGRGLAGIRHKSGCEAFTYYAMWNLSSHFDSFDNEGTVFGSINQKDLKSLKVIVSCEQIRKAFSTVANSFDEHIRVNSNQILNLQNLRDSLLPKLLSGELSVDGVGDE
jgi:type I restriction enzyme S subunit